MLIDPLKEDSILEITLRPETDLERKLLMDPEVQMGMMWGRPRYGHPEGQVYKHVREVLDNIDALALGAKERERLRLITFIHDVFKYKEDKNRPRDWNRHHAVIARRFMNSYIDDELVLAIIQWHDEAYYIWRDKVINKKEERANFRMTRLLEKLKGQTQLYYYFFYCDSMTGDKNPAPIHWVGDNLPGVIPIKEDTHPE